MKKNDLMRWLPQWPTSSPHLPQVKPFLITSEAETSEAKHRMLRAIRRKMQGLVKNN